MITAVLILAAVSLTPSTRQAQSGPLGCVPAAPNDPAPWIWRARILGSFTPDAPRPRFLGGFGDAHSEYELQLWQDARGIFGQLLTPVLDADSPDSPLYDARLDATTGALTFTARFADGERHFSGRLHSDSVTGTITHAALGDTVVLRKLDADHVHGASDESYNSRAQFECAMTLFRRN